MNKRLGFLLVLSATALAWVGCDGNPATGDAGCPDGTICLDRDSGTDGGVRDSGRPDSGPVMTGCMQATGRAGGQCRSGTTCGPGLTCAPELSRLMSGQAFTLRNVFEIPNAVLDPASPDGYTVMDGLPDVPIRFGPGGQCTQGCNPSAMTDSCPACSTCETSIGGSSAFGAVGITVRTFDATEPAITNSTNTGMCRADCTFNPATNGGCQAGYTCDPTANVCLEACTADSQCNLTWGVTRREGLVAVVDGTATCNTTTGRCQWTPPAGASFGSECDADADCGADVGACVFGRCTSWQCNLPDASGMAARYPCAEGAVCVQFPGNNPALCVATCEAPSDCFPGQACIEFFGDGGRACWGICTADAECQTGERCRIGGFTNPELGTCQPTCDPSAGTGCAEGEACIAPEGVTTHGFCEDLGGICTTDDDCLPNEACEWLGNDAFGRCVEGCDSNADCADGQSCRIQTGSTLGVCRTPGGACAPSPVSRDGTMRVLYPELRGNGSPQCVAGQTCSSTMADVVGTCTGTPTP
jgi:hypothetical protein